MKSNGSKKLNRGFVLILIACLLLLNGCWGKREVEELAPLIGIGIDLGQKPGSYIVTYQFSIPQKGGGTGAELEDRTISVEASTAREADDKISRISSRIIFMGSLKVVVIGEDVAKAGFIERLDFEQRFSEFRRSLYLVIAKGKAQSLLNLKLRTGELPAIYIKECLDGWENLSAYPMVNLGHYLNVLSRKSTAPIITLVKSVKSGEGGIEYKAEGKDEAEEIQFEGAVVLRGDRLADFLTDKETKGYMWLDNYVVNRLLYTKDIEESDVIFGGEVLKATTKHKVKGKDGTIGLQYQIKVNIGVDEVMGLKEQLSETEWVELLKGAETSFAKMIQNECELSILKQRELGLDFLGIGRYIEQRNPSYWKTVKDQWEEKIADFPISLDVQVTIHHSGMSSSSATTN